MEELLQEIGRRILRSAADYQKSRERSREYDGMMRIDDVSSGEVVKVDRGFYDHYGIFLRTLGRYGGEELHVIHYTGRNGHNDFNGIVRETALSTFLDGAEEFMVCSYVDGKCRQRFAVRDINNTRAYTSEFSGMNELADSPEREGVRAVERGRSRIGAEGYSLPVNNCEHFAVWCRTGESESSQVNDVLHALIMPEG
ncbi:MAG: lecithin retinol acyltransferase family protein [Synergistaceae bacterium]|nr:lecithin retinol acyltransferase family protein [Synergistaceae bacterium]